jgi:type I restriction enzyme M protein
MLTDGALKAQVDQLWNKLWGGGLTNPLDSIEQISYLLFMKRLDEEDLARGRAAGRRGAAFTSLFPETDKEGNPARLRWSEWTQMTADSVLGHVKERVFPFIRALGDTGGAFEGLMANAEFKVPRAGLLLECCALIDAMHVSQQNQDVQGDLYEYLLGRLNTAGLNGQFRTPRHISRLMVQMIEPRAHERVCDPAAGTGGFLVNAYQRVLETHTTPETLTYDDDGFPHHLDGDRLTEAEETFLQAEGFTGFDNDSGMTVLRIGAMNLMLHGLQAPRFRYADTLSKAFTEARRYEVILANPPFKGAIDAGELSPTLPPYRKTELLFLHLFLRLLEIGGRCAAIVPDGVLFGSSTAHVETRKTLIEMNRLDGVVSMPSGVFKPYAGVSTAILLFTKGASTSRVWFYDMAHDGYSLDDKRQRVSDSDLPDLLACWNRRTDPDFAAARASRLSDLRAQIEPLKAERLTMQAEINRLTFEHAVAPEAEGEAALRLLDADRQRLADLEAQIHPLQREMNQLSRQFWVSKAQIAAHKYDLSASRYRQVEQDEAYYDDPKVTLERLVRLETVMAEEARELAGLLS